MSGRMDRDEMYMKLAELVSERSTCPRLSVGAALLPSGSTSPIVSYNGAPKGIQHCEGSGCIESGDHCILSSHAELNALLQASSLGIKTKGGTIYVTHLPCVACMRSLRNAEVETIIYSKFYPYSNEAEKKLFALLAPQFEIWNLIGSEKGSYTKRAIADYEEAETIYAEEIRVKSHA